MECLRLLCGTMKKRNCSVCGISLEQNHFSIMKQQTEICFTEHRSVRIMEQPGFVKELNEEMLQLYLTLTYWREKIPFPRREEITSGTLSDLEKRKNED